MAARSGGSWLDLSALRRSTGAEGAVPGSGLGLPPDGPGAAAGLGRRLLALVVDWMVSLLVAGAVLTWTAPHAGAAVRQFAPLVVFAVMSIALVTTTGSTIGKRMTGTAVRSTGGGRLTAGRVVARTVMLCLVLPAATALVDPDQRGLHDRLTGAVAVRSR